MKNRNLRLGIIALIITNIIAGVGLINIRHKYMSNLEYYKGLDNAFGETYKIYNILKLDYQKDIDEDKFLLDINKHIVESLNEEYTHYLTEEEYKEKYGKLMENEFVGLKINYTKTDDNKILVIGIDENSQTYKDGLRENDIIIEINSKLEYNEMKDEMSKIADYSLKLKILREGKPLEIETHIEKLDANNVYSEIIGNQGYIVIKEFGKNSYEEFLDEIKSLSSQGISDLIVDLRNNTGGIVDEAIKISNFLTGGRNIVEFTKLQKEYKSKKINKDMNIEVLINEYTASSSEILAANLDEYYVSIGNKTYGKGVSQNVIKLNKGYLVYTNDEFKIHGENINKKGILPDINIDMNPYDTYSMTGNLDNDIVLKFALDN